MHPEMVSTKPRIKIFVSHRTDLISDTIDNPVYVNIRCGAVYDKENKSNLQGDDTGNNISHKKPYLSELTLCIGHGKTKKQIIMAYAITVDICHLANINLMKIYMEM